MRSPAVKHSPVDGPAVATLVQPAGRVSSKIIDEIDLIGRGGLLDVEKERLRAATDALEREIAKVRRNSELGVAPREEDLRRDEISINRFLARFFDGTSVEQSLFHLPHNNCILLDTPGMAREASLPKGENEYVAADLTPGKPIVQSVRLVNNQGVLHTPGADKRTTEGIFHVSEGGLDIPAHTKPIPKEVSARIVAAALNPGWRPSGEHLEDRRFMDLPWTSNGQKLDTMVCGVVRPKSSPKVDGVCKEQYMEVSVYAPGSLISNIDFLQEVFNNPEQKKAFFKDAGLDAEHFSGQTGSIIFAPHLIGISNRELGIDKDGLYNNGGAFKLCVRDSSGHYVMIVADNYFGYGKKGIKDILSYTCNSIGQTQEIHAGGAIAYQRQDLGTRFIPAETRTHERHYTFDNLLQRYKDVLHVREDGPAVGYAVHKDLDNAIFLHQSAEFDLDHAKVRWKNSPDGDFQELPLRQNIEYILPSGYSVSYVKDVIKNKNSASTFTKWKLVGCEAEGIVFHKPDSVSGAGKSEISKSIKDAVTRLPATITDFDAAIERISALADVTWENRYKPGKAPRHFKRSTKRTLFDRTRSIASAVRLLTPSEEYFNSNHNDYVKNISGEVKNLIYIVMQLYRSEQPRGKFDPEHFKGFLKNFKSLQVDGERGHFISYKGRKIFQDHLRVGEGRDFRVRSDWHPNQKFIREDDISVGRSVRKKDVKGLGAARAKRTGDLVFVTDNVEYKLFQRPDDAFRPGYDVVAERDFARRSGFFTNYAPLPVAMAAKIMENEQYFDEYTDPVKKIIQDAAKAHEAGEGGYFVIPSHRRMVMNDKGKLVPTENPRYLQKRPDLIAADEVTLADFRCRINRNLSLRESLPSPVDVVVPGRRLNKPQVVTGADGQPVKVRSLAVMGPIHHQELPEYIAESFASLTGKSPSTTGHVAFERSRTKGPFNSLRGIIDIEDMMVASALSGNEPFISAAGFIGDKYKVDHDITLLMAEVFSRLLPEQRTVAYFKKQGWLVPVQDVTLNIEGEMKTAPASILGWRISEEGRDYLFGTMFENPAAVIPNDMLFPERQENGLSEYFDGVMNIVEAQKKVAEELFADKSVDTACRPLKALLHIMRDGEYHDSVSGETWTRESPNFRKLFTREAILESDWYQERLAAQAKIDQRHWQERVDYIAARVDDPKAKSDAVRAGSSIRAQLARAKLNLFKVKHVDYVAQLYGTPGAHRDMANFALAA